MRIQSDPPAQPQQQDTQALTPTRTDDAPRTRNESFPGLPRRQPALDSRVSRPRAQSSSRTAANTASASRVTSGSTVIERGAGPSTPELTAALQKTLKDLEPGFFDRRPKLVKGAVELLQPLVAKRQLTRQDLLTLIDAAATLRALPQEKRGRLSSAQHASIEHLARAADAFVGPASALHASLDKLSSDLEARQNVPDFTAYLRQKHPDMLERDPASGSYRLNETGQKNYSRIKQMFENQARKRHMVQPDERSMTDHEKIVAKLIEGGYLRYQQAMRAPDDRIETRKTLIECAQIVESLAQANPERVSRDRYATVFPGGITHPRQLVEGREYTEPGIVFVGGERPADEGYRMEINLTKGIPVDARPLYGHQGDNEEKLQWLTLPGAKFRFDGQKGSGSEKMRTYEFTQIDR